MSEVFRTLDKAAVPIDAASFSWPLLRAGKPERFTGTAQAGTSTSVTLPAGASATTNLYKDMWCAIVGGTGAGQVRKVTAYDGTTKIATIDPAWDTTPDATSALDLFLAEKFFVQNIGVDVADDQSLTLEPNGDSDGINYAKIGADGNGTKSCPFNVQISKAAGAGTFGATGTKGLRLVAVYSGKVTGPSLEVTIAITATTDEITVTWDEDGAPDAIRVYGTDTPGTYGASSLVEEIAGGVGTYTWTGTAPGAGTLPTANLTGGDTPTYGVPPTMGTTPLTVSGPFKRGQQFPYWFQRRFPSGVSGETRSAVVRLVGG